MSTDNPLQPFLKEQGVVILDGALATELEDRGADLRDELWSARLLIEDPAAVRQLHVDYFAAGADVAISASYQASFEGFARRGLSRSEGAALMQHSVRLAKEARQQFWDQASHSTDQTRRLRPLVAASVGSYGACLADGSEYRGNYGLSVEALKAWHRPRLEALLAAEPDLLACETIPCLCEGESLVELFEEYRETPAWLSFSCRDESRVSQGELFASCVELANGCSTVVAVGLNCSSPRHAGQLLRRARAVTAKPLVCYPNRGERWDSATHSWVARTGSVDFAAQAASWKAAGAQLIGGCCRTSPRDIRRLRELLLGSQQVDSVEQRPMKKSRSI